MLVCVEDLGVFLSFNVKDDECLCQTGGFVAGAHELDWQ